jgi:hypothetical protein
MTWDGGDFETYRDDPSSYTVVLDDDDLKSIDAAVKGYKGKLSPIFNHCPSSDEMCAQERHPLWTRGVSL